MEAACVNLQAPVISSEQVSGITANAAEWFSDD
jgi:hypothetical protein